MKELSTLSNKAILGDALEIMKQIPSESVDMTFADPPFNLNKKYGKYYDEKNISDYFSWCNEWLQQMVRITKPTGSIFVHNIPKWLTYYSTLLNDLAKFKHWIAWDAMGAPLGKTILPNHYGILWYVKSDKFKFFDVRAPHRYCRECDALLKDYGGKKNQIHPFGTLISDVWTDIYRIRHVNRRDDHPCQLPIHLLERLILMVTEEADIVLDPFLGTGTTAIAAKRLGRKYIGIDIDSEYIQIAQAKLEDTYPIKINNCYVSIFLDKIITIRDLDYDKIAPFLLTKQLYVKKGITKTLTQPTLNKSLVSTIENPKSNILKKLELTPQIKLMEKKTGYKGIKQV
ncbi:MAG: site-specific DNA-methyltransferase [Dehalococcoidales bacterium]|nr:site-specific DNA-methyltransferase [Dehalococcoidales bacterium]